MRFLVFPQLLEPSAAGLQHECPPHQSLDGICGGGATLPPTTIVNMISKLDGIEQSFILIFWQWTPSPFSSRVGPCGFSTVISACSPFMLASCRRLPGGFAASGNAVGGIEMCEDYQRFLLFKWGSWLSPHGSDCLWTGPLILVPSCLDIIHTMRSALALTARMQCLRSICGPTDGC